MGQTYHRALGLCHSAKTQVSCHHGGLHSSLQRCRTRLAGEPQQCVLWHLPRHTVQPPLLQGAPQPALLLCSNKTTPKTQPFHSAGLCLPAAPFALAASNAHPVCNIGCTYSLMSGKDWHHMDPPATHCPVPPHAALQLHMPAGAREGQISHDPSSAQC